MTNQRPTGSHCWKSGDWSEDAIGKERSKSRISSKGNGGRRIDVGVGNLGESNPGGIEAAAAVRDEKWGNTGADDTNDGAKKTELPARQTPMSS
jgi:hypothetical protein